MSKYTLLMPAGQIPDGECVTKRNGSKTYILRRSIRIHQNRASRLVEPEPSGQPREIRAEDGAVFLVWGNGDVTAIGADTLLHWTVDEQELRLLLDGPAQ